MMNSTAKRMLKIVATATFLLAALLVLTGEEQRMLRTDDALPPPSGTCFSGTTTVETQDRGHVPMPEVLVGDYVLASSEPRRFEKVYAFAHRVKNIAAEIVHLELESTSDELPPQKVLTSEDLMNAKDMVEATTSSSSTTSLELTGNHLVYVKGRENPIGARGVQTGDYLVHQSSGQSSPTFVRVSNVSRVTNTDGLYAPLTTSGDIIVNHGIKASAYGPPIIPGALEYVEFAGGVSSGISQQWTAHMLLAPMRVVCMGIAPQLCDTNAAFAADKNGHGFPLWIDVLNSLTETARDSMPMFLQAILLAFFWVIFGTVLAVEVVVGPILTPWVIVGLAGLGVMIMNKRRNTNTDTMDKKKVE